MIELPREIWRAVVDVLRAKGLHSMLEHADGIERALKRHGPDVDPTPIGLIDASA